MFHQLRHVSKMFKKECVYSTYSPSSLLLKFYPLFALDRLLCSVWLVLQNALCSNDPDAVQFWWLLRKRRENFFNFFLFFFSDVKRAVSPLRPSKN